MNDKVKKALFEGTDLPAGTVLNFYNPEKEKQDAKDIQARATMNEPPKRAQAEPTNPPSQAIQEK